MDAGLLIGDHPGTDAGQRVDHSVHRLFVAGDQRGGQDDQVVGGDGDAAVLAAGHPRQRRERLALGAGGDEDQPVRRHHLRGRDVDDVAVVDGEKTEFAGDRHVAHHRTADEGHPPAERHRRVDDLLDPIDVGCETGHQYPFALGIADQPVQRRADLTLRGTHAGHLGIGRVAQEQVDSGVTQSRHPGQIGGPAVQWKLVEFDVAGVQNRAGAGVDRDGQRVGDGVIDCEVLALEHTVGAALPLDHFDQHRLDAVFPAFGGDQREGEPGAHHRDVGTLFEQERDRADVVLVGVR